jgi:hypothetical protein
MLPFTPRSSKMVKVPSGVKTKTLCALLLCHTPRPPHPSSYGPPNNIGEVYKLWNQTPYAMFSSRLLLPPSEAKHPPQHPTLDTISFCSSKLPHQQTQINIIFAVTQKAGTYQLSPCPCACSHGMTLPQAADGRDGLQVWTMAANVLNKQLGIAEKGHSPT